MTEHTVTVRTAEAPGMPTLYRPQCTCAWRGAVVQDPTKAWEQAVVHQKTQVAVFCPFSTTGVCPSMCPSSRERACVAGP